MSEWHIRLAQIGDAECFRAVEEDAAELLRDEPSLEGIPLPSSASAESYRRIIAKRHSLSATADDRIVGFAACVPIRRELHLQEMGVLRTHQRQGIGSTLLRAIGIDAQNCGFSAITLDTFRSVPWNAPFYARHGFVEIENFEGRQHLANSLEETAAAGIPHERRCAMIRFLR